MKKDKIIKIFYILFVIISICCICFLLMRPLSSENIYANYDTINKIKVKELPSTIEQNIYITNDRTFKIFLFFGDERTINNWEISLLDEGGNIVFSQFVEDYTAREMYFVFSFLEKNKNYTFRIKDYDGDSIFLNSVSSDGKTCLLDDTDSSIQIVTYYYKYNYFFLWYPIFLLAILYLIFPYVWSDKNEKK